ncbi:hypothetical protein PC129_g17466 [Phytophthora cactorum]|uniref:Uncharacterized protein n=1 Tax=Phytophthora cactorum TaxID=29920 RepID=A0A329RRQ8_9STRA|nr:hypothetical protein Pcac1_g14962 [Phytophthora cactorum]KAG2815353.1 hypothetical protein PC112_g13919 [Phytophthora cactorum]KAG2816748.1 hypothetical protein PC111_g13024 [Phytophthora cactorum]KAG2853104.1 hypothetical protein PC113_g14457 [Phytophthora cactorum]KAG2895197.1 hypothetical protein PC114_g15588 [Phytophthora cactorum]
MEMEDPWQAWWLTDTDAHPYNPCFCARNRAFLVFTPRGIDPRVVENAIEENFDWLSRPLLGLPHAEIIVMAFISSRGLGSANSTEDGLGSPNTYGASSDTSLFGTPSPESPSSQHGGPSSSVTTSAAFLSSASASAPPGSSGVGLLVATATAASPVVAPQSIVSAPSQPAFPGQLVLGTEVEHLGEPFRSGQRIQIRMEVYQHARHDEPVASLVQRHEEPSRLVVASSSLGRRRVRCCRGTLTPHRDPPVAESFRQ